ncbi:MAG: NAD(P)H-binding protein [Rhodospirillales bacterium]|nr:NAD(P)H-binding protein [Rhodospirillales bacterium]
MRPALILGATGSFGGGVAREMLARGHPVRLLVRDPAKASARFATHEHAETVTGDAQDAAALRRAAAGCGVIVHGVNYPYDQWRPHMVTATANVVAAAREAGATILFPGNVYGLGRQTSAPLPETAPMTPCSRKGRLRVDLENMLRQAADDGARTLVVRAGDYFGPTVRNGLVDPIFKSALAKRRMTVFGNLEAPHQWAYGPDLARCAVDVLALEGRLAPFAVVHFAGHVVPRQRDFLAVVAREAGAPGIPVRRMPWAAMRLIGLFSPVVRELMELRYLFDEAVILDDPARRALLPDFRPTPLSEAVRHTLGSYRAGQLTP